MDDVIFERDYSIPCTKTAESSFEGQVLERVMDGNFLKAYADAMDRIPKIIVPQDKENYDYLLPLCDNLAKRLHGKVKGVVDYHRWHSYIDVHLPFLAFESPEEMRQMKEISERAHSVTVQPSGNGIRLHIAINYFEELMTETEHTFLTIHALQQDKQLTGILNEHTQLPEEAMPEVTRLQALLKRFETETQFPPATVFAALAERITAKDPVSYITQLADLAERLLNAALSETPEEDAYDDQP